MRTRFALAAALGLLILPAPAIGQQTLAPPGKAGADQYFETIPSGAGNAKPPDGTRSIGGGGSGISTATLRELARSKDGSAAAAFATGTAPRTAGRPGAHASNGSGPASTALRPLGGSDSGGLGIALPILLATIALVIAMLAAALRRGRREAT